MEEVVGEEETEGTEGTVCEGNGLDGIERMVGRAGEEVEISVVERSNSESGQEHSQARSLSYLNIPNEESEGWGTCLTLEGDCRLGRSPETEEVLQES